MHVGHGRGAVLGLAISNLLETQGYKVSKEYYVNDAGRQIDILALSVLLTEIDDSIPKDGLYLGSYIKILASELSKIVKNKGLALQLGGRVIHLTDKVNKAKALNVFVRFFFVIKFLLGKNILQSSFKSTH